MKKINLLKSSWKEEEEKKESASEQEEQRETGEVNPETEEISDNQEDEKEPEVRGNYSKASADKLWKDIK